MAAYVVVQLKRRSGSKKPRDRETALKSAEVKRLLSQHGASLLPDSGHSEATDADAFTTIAVPDMSRANALAAALRRIDSIETAYAKPGEELP